MKNPIVDQGGAERPSAPELSPQKLYYKIGEVCAITQIPSHVLRFWEKQFPQLRPNKTPSGHRLYKKRDVQIILQIKELLYERRFTIKGAREFLVASRRDGALQVPTGAGVSLGRIKEGLLKLRAILDRQGPFDT